MCDKNRPKAGKAIANLTQPMPLHKKLFLIIANNLNKIRNRKMCCGHAGQPGC
jgi:hypothetical protein